MWLLMKSNIRWPPDFLFYFLLFNFLDKINMNFVTVVAPPHPDPLKNIIRLRAPPMFRDIDMPATDVRVCMCRPCVQYIPFVCVRRVLIACGDARYEHRRIRSTRDSIG